jgi:hypothetical protein
MRYMDNPLYSATSLQLLFTYSAYARGWILVFIYILQKKRTSGLQKMGSAEITLRGNSPEQKTRRQRVDPLQNPACFPFPSSHIPAHGERWAVVGRVKVEGYKALTRPTNFVRFRRPYSQVAGLCFLDAQWHQGRGRFKGGISGAVIGIQVE